jgi:hypothetical protein
MSEQRMKVHLRVWGVAQFDADRARQDATVRAAEQDWDIVDLETTTKARNPIPRRDTSALVQGKAYNHAWALYRADPQPTPEG